MEAPMRKSLLLLGVPAAFAVGSAAAVVYLFANHHLDADLPAPAGHFYVVTAVALICLALSVPAAIATLRSADVRLLALTLAFLSIAGFFSVHGLATPGFLVSGSPYIYEYDEHEEAAHDAAASGTPAAAPSASTETDGYGDYDYGYGSYGGGASTEAGHDVMHADVVGFSARLAMLFGALFLAASAVSWPERFALALANRAGAVIAAWAAVLSVYFFAGIIVPQYLPPEFLSKVELLNASLVVVLVASAFAAARYALAYRRSALPLHGSAAVAGVLMLEAQIGMHFGEVWYLSWWVYHFQLLAGFGVLLAGVSAEHLRGRSAVEALDRLSLRDALSQIEAGFSDSIRTLAASLEARDPYTHGHGRRVAALAYYAGRELGFSSRRLRGVVRGALLHDVGKIGVPDAVLLKPGKLTDEEFARIKQHPHAGEQLMLVASTGTLERAIIRHHHEWFDGSGYPDGLHGGAIPLEARLVAVADVYDALCSNRAYRPAWSRERTVELLRAESGTHFDPRCVEALLRAVDLFETEFEPETAQQRAIAPIVEAQAA
jgi:HD-GYP domain-containing protein (c-di-GMP phosphodiesterase class II)